MKLTTPEVTVQMSDVELVTDFVPSPVVETVGVNDPLKVPEAGRLVIDGVDGEVRPIDDDVPPLV
jgi:hypothetical protein